MQTIAQEWEETNSGMRPEEIDSTTLILLRHTFYLGVNAMMLRAQEAAKLAATDPAGSAAAMNTIAKEINDYFLSIDVAEDQPAQQPAAEPSRILLT